jgi:hypothetical protein
MRPETIATYEQLSAVEWFRNVGRYTRVNAICVGSWEDAILSCTSLAWQNLILEAANQYRERLIERSPKRFSLWNDIVIEIKHYAFKLVHSKISRVTQQGEFPKLFIDTVEWDILQLGMESEYQDVYPPDFSPPRHIGIVRAISLAAGSEIFLRAS